MTALAQPSDRRGKVLAIAGIGLIGLLVLIAGIVLLFTGRYPKPIYDFVTHLRSGESIAVEPSDVIVIDGILLFVDERVRELCDVKVFVDADADIRLIRRIQRDLTTRGRPLGEIIDQYLSTVQPMHLQFVEPSKRYADIIVPRGGHNAVAIEMIVAKIKQRLGYSTSGLAVR